MDELLDSGIYAIINKKLKIVYVGETEASFLIRWIEHTARIPKYLNQQDRMNLYLDNDTKYIILKKIDAAIHNTYDFLRWEDEAIQFYKDKGWTVVSHNSFSSEREHTRIRKDDVIYSRYRKAINHMIRALGLINTKNNNVPALYSKLYTKIDKHFETDVKERNGKNVMETLKKEELEFIMLDLFPRYQQKMLAMYRTEFENLNSQLSIFDLYNTR